MRHTLLSLLVVVTLLSMWGWQAHAYQDHDAAEPGHICELCVTAAAHVAITPSQPQLPEVLGHEAITPHTSTAYGAVAPRFYPVRAPPRFL